MDSRNYLGCLHKKAPKRLRLELANEENLNLLYLYGLGRII